MRFPCGLEDEDVLRGQLVPQLDQLEACRFPFCTYLPGRHAVVELDVTGRLTVEAILDERHAAARRQRLVNAGQHGAGLLELVVKNEPDNVEAIYYLGSCNFRLGNHEEAAKTWRALTERFPDSRQAERARKHLDSIKN